MEKLIQTKLATIDDYSSITEMKVLTGGEINQALYIKTSEHQYFVKSNTNVPSNFFSVEAKGLKLIKATNTLKTPEIHYYDQPSNGETGVMILDWIEGAPTDTTIAALGYQLAHMHHHTYTKFGFSEETFVGMLSQPNGFFDDWITYFKNQRMMNQYRIAIKRNRLPEARRSGLEKLIERIDKWLDPNVKPSLLHGDLWNGNWMAGPNGQPYVIDPTVVYGDHAFEIAYTELFERFPEDFYDAYQEVFPLSENYHDYREIYHLYYLLVHLNIFGEKYGSAVDRIIAKYV